MTFEIGLTLFILAAAIVLFATERFRVDLVALMVLLSLLLTGLLTTEQAFSGFASPAVITVWAIYIVSASLTHTGIADYFGVHMGRIAGTGEARLILVIMVVVGAMSAFMNNIGATAVLLPVVIALGQKANIPPSKLLIPLAFGSLLGGITTLIGTPPNLLASNALAAAGYEPFSLFDYTPMGLIIMVSSITYMVLVGRHLLPHREKITHAHQAEQLTDEYRLKDYLAELRVEENSPLVGQTLIASGLGARFDINVMGVQRDGHRHMGLLTDIELQVGDVLFTRGPHGRLLQMHDEMGVSILPDFVLDADLKSPEATIAEVVIGQKAWFLGRTLKELDFRERYGLTVLAIWREESPMQQKLSDTPLHLGDTLLVHGRRDRIEAIRQEDAFLLLREPEKPNRRLNRAPINLVIFVTMIGLVAAGKLHISVAAVLGAVLSILTGCLTMDEAYEAIEWKSVFLIAGMLPMGIAMEVTGTAQFLANLIINTVGGWGPAAVLIGLFVLTSLITEFMSNAAAAVLVAPIAISTAVGLDADPRAYVMGVAIAASNSFLFPIGHQASVLVYGAGGYRFFDFTRVGLPLQILIWILMIIFLPIFWPL